MPAPAPLQRAAALGLKLAASLAFTAPLLTRITAPTLITRAALSPVLTQEMAERLHASVPHASLVTIPGAYHHLTLDRPAEFTAALSTFLATL